MRIIDLASWPHRAAFEIYRHFDYPHFNLTANIEVDEFTAAVKARSASFTIAVVYTLARAANELQPFRLRIHGEQVVEHERVDPSFTVLLEDERFSFCTVEYRSDFQSFSAEAAEHIEQVRRRPTLEDEAGQDNLLFMTSIPWISFTSMQHPIHMHPVDSVPRLGWGRIFKDHGQLRMPLSVQVNHALMDGLHVGRYYELVTALMANPDQLFG
jgi:chloramphenicol O-acetyltransferase type A